MLGNYLKIALRNIKKQKGFFAINFIGLYISILVCLIIAIIIFHEISFDRQKTGSYEVYRVVNNTSSATGTTYNPVTPYPLATAMRTSINDEAIVSQIHFHNQATVTVNGRKIKENRIIFADSVFSKIFPIHVINGSIQTALAQPGFVLLTEKTARRIFGKEDAVGKRLKLDNVVDLEVAAVIKDAPGNTHLPFNMIVSFLSLRPEFIGGLPLDQWGINSDGFTYIGLKNQNQIAGIEKNLASIADKNLNEERDGSLTVYKLQPLADIHFNQLYAENNPAYTINIQYLYLLAAVGLFLILAACINYTNLSTALALRKSKEVGVRKTMGASRKQLVGQFFAETAFLSLIVIIAAAISVPFLIPAINNFLEKEIATSYLNLPVLLFLFLLWIIVSTLSGIYPAFILSGFNPISALKNKITAPKASTVFLRRGLVTFQFITAQVLIIGAIVVSKQMYYINSRSLGFEKDQIVDIALPENKPEQLKAFKNQLRPVPGISSVSLSLGAPISDNGFHTGYNLKEKYSSEQIDVEVKVCDSMYLNTYGLQLIAGRWFNQADELAIAESIPDSLKKYTVIINETAAKKLGFSNPNDAVNTYITLGLNNLTVPVVGVIKDYHVESLHAPIQPVLMIQFPFFFYNAGLKLSSAKSANTLAAVEKAFSSVFPEHLFEASFLDEHVAKQYQNDKRTVQLFNLFTIISIVINALGLIGLLSFMVEQKRKEIGIRKVLGAGIANISFILSKDFLRLIGVAFLIAAPLAWYVMNRWLQDFAYRTHLSWWIFVIAGIAALTVTALVVSFQTLKAALANPVKNLRTE